MGSISQLTILQIQMALYNIIYTIQEKIHIVQEINNELFY